MRVGRTKKVNKDLRRYKLIFGLEEPYRVLIDPSFVHRAHAESEPNEPSTKSVRCRYEITVLPTIFDIRTIHFFVEKSNTYI